jgi:hypothetical protein
MVATGIRQQRRRVRVWFGDCPIVDGIGDPAHAERLAAAMRRWGAGVDEAAARATGVRVLVAHSPP